ncbi:MAG: dihydroorotase [Desulfomicrobium sp.]|nr:dihydroorotase [Pseudomonadota bacterium]MBV1713558.1 dihydroorotase [Desulfomicrobium sp.]MBU4572094.1 dihydroorotase [Pseudomonadota bacterium]MBU4594072.1 dihydroorotase [Pseudomonadota bacterium]MBV1720977.1 dihydroorotase [Desulfomicrobium sp.]
MLNVHSPLDMHVHLRQGDMLNLVAPYTARDFAAAVVMPNLTPPVTSLAQVLDYRQAILRAVGESFTPLMTLFFRAYSRAELLEARPHIIGVKLYPAGMTTNSEDGPADMDEARATLAIMEELGIPLLVHGEGCGFVMDREALFLPVVEDWARSFPRLRIVLEHVTTRAGVELLDRFDNLFATITLHHLLITLDDVLGGLMRPHLFCKPVAKRPEDRDALRRAALNHPKAFFGSDTAPHPLEAKEASGCAAGIFSAPVALPALAGLFEELGALDRLQAFVSDRACAAYGLTPIPRQVRLERRAWIVPERIGCVTPYLAGQTLAWQVAG